MLTREELDEIRIRLNQIYGWLGGSPGSVNVLKCLKVVLELIDKEYELQVECERG